MKSEGNPNDITAQLLQCEDVENDPQFARRLGTILEYTQILYDDDENLTRTGNLSGEAKAQLRSRIHEVFDLSPSS